LESLLAHPGSSKLEKQMQVFSDAIQVTDGSTAVRQVSYLKELRAEDESIKCATKTRRNCRMRLGILQINS
jgi:glucosamine 6-phosphate synthetase-like amidotransferase/phosphosugar isomerase protein